MVSQFHRAADARLIQGLAGSGRRFADGGGLWHNHHASPRLVLWLILMLLSRRLFCRDDCVRNRRLLRYPTGNFVMDRTTRPLVMVAAFGRQPPPTNHPHPPWSALLLMAGALGGCECRRPLQRSEGRSADDQAGPDRDRKEFAVAADADPF